MDFLLLLLFILNVVLALVDASVAYHKAPRYIGFFNSDPEGRDSGVKRVTSLLPLVVALYVSLDCYAYSLRHAGYLAGLALLLVADILVQMAIARKGEAASDDGA